MSVPSLAFRPGRAAWLMALLALACSPEPTAYQLDEASLSKGKGGGGGGGGGTGGEVSVTSVFPAAGAQGETLYMVKVSGSGFESGAKVAWERNGVVDPLVRVLATRFKSSTEIEVDIAIDETAVVDNYDVSVTLKSGKRGVGIESFEVKEGDPTATWMIPLEAGHLSLRSDGAFGTGSMSAYADGVCGVTAKIFATTAASTSGDATLGMDATKGRNACARTVTVAYPDGVSEAVRTFANLRRLHNDEYIIPVGATVKRTFALNPAGYANNPSRCGRLLFGEGGQGNGIGSDSVLVTRLGTRTWRVQSDPASNRLAWCESTGDLFALTIDFTIVAETDLP